MHGLSFPSSSAGRIAIIALVTIVTSSCGGGDDEASTHEARCAAAGAPVTVGELVDVFRANQLSLDVNERECRLQDGLGPDATNLGRTGLEQNNAVIRREGTILCDVGSSGLDRDVEVVKYATDEETYVRALNVQCAVYPSDGAHERTQVDRVRDALRAVVESTAESD